MTEAGALEAQVSQQVIVAMKAHDPQDAHDDAAADRERAEEQRRLKRGSH